MRAKVTTLIDGQKIVVTGRLNVSQTVVTDSRGMKLHIQSNDVVEILESNPRAAAPICCPFDLHKWFKQSKQI